MSGWEWYVLALLALVVVITRIEVMVLRRREKDMLRREAEIDAWTRLDGERTKVTEEKARQAYERGWAEGEKAAQGDLRVEYWTQVNRQQGYFFASKEVLAFTQLMYRNIPLGPAQRHVLEKSEAVDRKSIERMLTRVLGENEPEAVSASPHRLRLVKREPEEQEALQAAGTGSGTRSGS